MGVLNSQSLTDLSANEPAITTDSNSPMIPTTCLVRKLGIVIRPHSIFKCYDLRLNGNYAELLAYTDLCEKPLFNVVSIDILNQFLGKNEVKDP